MYGAYRAAPRTPKATEQRGARSPCGGCASQGLPASEAKEEGVNVQIALDFVMMAVRGEDNMGVLMFGDTATLRAVEEVTRLNDPVAEVAAWKPPTGHERRLRLRN